MTAMRALERLLTCAALLFLGAGLAVLVLDGMDRQSAASQPFDQRSGGAIAKPVVRLVHPQHPNPQHPTPQHQGVPRD